jgi:hypothetical protein
MKLSPTELALVNFDGRLRATDLNRAALHTHQHGFLAEHASVSDSMYTGAIFVLDPESRFAVHDVVRDEYNFEESKITVLEPRSVLDRPRI